MSDRRITFDFSDRSVACTGCGVAPAYRMVNGAPLHRLCDEVETAALERQRQADQAAMYRPRKKK